MAVPRNTIQKQLIKEALRKLEHPTADDIYCYLHEEHPAVGKATLYRNLKTMSEEGLIIKLNPQDGSAARFDDIVRPHFHGKCRKCGILCDIDMSSEAEAALKENIKDAHGFLVENHELMFTGLCPECKNKEEKQ